MRTPVEPTTSGAPVLAAPRREGPSRISVRSVVPAPKSATSTSSSRVQLRLVGERRGDGLDEELHLREAGQLRRACAAAARASASASGLRGEERRGGPAPPRPAARPAARPPPRARGAAAAPPGPRWSTCGPWICVARKERAVQEGLHRLDEAPGVVLQVARGWRPRPRTPRARPPGRRAPSGTGAARRCRARAAAPCRPAAPPPCCWFRSRGRRHAWGRAPYRQIPARVAPREWACPPVTGRAAGARVPVPVGAPTRPPIFALSLSRQETHEIRARGGCLAGTRRWSLGTGCEERSERSSEATSGQASAGAQVEQAQEQLGGAPSTRRGRRRRRPPTSRRRPPSAQEDAAAEAAGAAGGPGQGAAGDPGGPAGAAGSAQQQTQQAQQEAQQAQASALEAQRKQQQELAQQNQQTQQQAQQQSAAAPPAGAAAGRPRRAPAHAAAAVAAAGPQAQAAQAQGSEQQISARC